MRIIAGKWKGKALHAPEGKEIRPTSSRSREALFNILVHLPDSPIEGNAVLDICCGSGALGIEALSRGAVHCTFIDNAPASLALTKRNIDAFAAANISKAVQANASQLPAASEPVSVAMIDPPYQHTGLVTAAYESLREKGWLEAGGLYCVEQFFKNKAPELDGAEILKQRRYGKSEITIYKLV